MSGFDFDELDRLAEEVDEPSDSEAEDGLFEYDVQGTLASRDVQGVELPEVLAAVVEPEGVPRIPPESLREAGNDCFRSGDFRGAERLYSTALLEISPPSPRVFSNRAAARLKLAKWEEALQDIMEATKRDPANPKVCERFARCLLLNNRLPEGVHICKQRLRNLSDEEKKNDWKSFLSMSMRLNHHAGVLHEMEGLLASLHSSTTKRSELSDAAAILHGCDSMLKLLTDVEKRSPFGVRLRFCQLRAYLYPIPGSGAHELSPDQGREWATKALELADGLLKEDPRWPDSHHWRARSLVRLQRRQEAREALRRAQLCAEERGGSHDLTEELLDSMRVVDQQKQKGNDAYRSQQWALAKDCYDLAIAADGLRMDIELTAQLYCNRAAVKARLGETAMDDLEVSLRLLPSYPKARFRRGMLYMELERYGDAARDFDLVFKEAPHFEGLKAWRSRALRWAVRPPAKNFYAKLGLAPGASRAEIKKAYRKMALKWHPDKNVGRMEEAAQRFKEVQEAFEVLFDPKLRKELDGEEWR